MPVPSKQPLPAAELEPVDLHRVPLNCSVDPELATALRAFARKRGVTISSVVSVAIVEYLHREFSK